MTLGKPGGIGSADRTLLNATVPAGGFLMAGTLGACDGIIEEQSNLLFKPPLVAFDSQDIVSFLSPDISP